MEESKLPYLPGECGNPAGKPPGAKSRASIPIRTRRQLIKKLTERALEEHDPIAQDFLALLCLRESA